MLICLQALRESVDALEPVSGDGAVQHRLVVGLQEMVGQLGPIGAAVDARWVRNGGVRVAPGAV